MNSRARNKLPLTLKKGYNTHNKYNLNRTNFIRSVFGGRRRLKSISSLRSHCDLYQSKSLHRGVASSRRFIVEANTKGYCSWAFCLLLYKRAVVLVNIISVPQAMMFLITSYPSDRNEPYPLWTKTMARGKIFRVCSDLVRNALLLACLSSGQSLQSVLRVTPAVDLLPLTSDPSVLGPFRVALRWKFSCRIIARQKSLSSSH